MLWLRRRKWDTSDQTCTHAPWANVRVKVASVSFLASAASRCDVAGGNGKITSQSWPFFHSGTKHWFDRDTCKKSDQKTPTLSQAVWDVSFEPFLCQVTGGKNWWTGVFFVTQMCFSIQLLYKCANSTPAGDCISSVATLNKSLRIWSCCLLVSCTGSNTFIYKKKCDKITGNMKFNWLGCHNSAPHLENVPLKRHCFLCLSCQLLIHKHG